MNVQFPIQPFDEVEIGTLVRKSGLLGKEVAYAHNQGFQSTLPTPTEYHGAVIIPVYGFQHGGPVVYKASKDGDPFSHMYMGFDSGLAGVVFVSARRVKQLTTRKRKPWTVEEIEAYLIHQVELQSDFESDQYYGIEEEDFGNDGCEGLQELLRI